MQAALDLWSAHKSMSTSKLLILRRPDPTLRFINPLVYAAQESAARIGLSFKAAYGLPVAIVDYADASQTVPALVRTFPRRELVH